MRGGGGSREERRSTASRSGKGGELEAEAHSPASVARVHLQSPLEAAPPAPLEALHLAERRDGCNQEEDASNEGGTFLPKS